MTRLESISLRWRETEDGKELIATYEGKIIGRSVLKQTFGSAIMISTINEQCVDGYTLQHHLTDEEIERRLTQEFNKTIEKSTLQTFRENVIAKIPLVIGGYHGKR